MRQTMNGHFDPFGRVGAIEYHDTQTSVLACLAAFLRFCGLPVRLDHLIDIAPIPQQGAASASPWRRSRQGRKRNGASMRSSWPEMQGDTGACSGPPTTPLSWPACRVWQAPSAACRPLPG
jgi:hypothetical protein